MANAMANRRGLATYDATVTFHMWETGGMCLEAGQYKSAVHSTIYAPHKLNWIIISYDCL